MPNYESALLFADITGSSPDWDRANDIAIPGFVVPTQDKTNWCWAAVGTGLYNFWCQPENPMSQPTFAAQFGNTSENVAKKAWEIMAALEEVSQIAKHIVIDGHDLLEMDELWKLLSQSIDRDRPVPIVVSWYGPGNDGHIICAFGTTLLNGERAVIVFDPSGADKHTNNIRRIAFSGDYENTYKQEGTKKTYKGYISEVYIPAND